MTEIPAKAAAETSPPKKLNAVEAMDAQIETAKVADSLAAVIQHPSIRWIDTLPDARKSYDDLRIQASRVLGQLLADGVVSMEDLIEKYLGGGNDD